MRFVQRLTARLRRLRQRSPAQRRLLAESVLELLRARLYLLLPFRWLERSLGTRMLESLQVVPPEVEPVITEVAWAVAAASTHVPWRTSCLVTAVATQRILTRRDLSSTLYLGVRTGQEAPQLTAHAWVRCGNRILVGESEHERFTVVATYTSCIEPTLPAGSP